MTAGCQSLFVRLRRGVPYPPKEPVLSRVLIPGDPAVALTLRRSARARRFSLRVSRLDGQVTLTLPRWAAEADALAFAHDKADWLRRMVSDSVPLRQARIGATLPFLGQECRIVAANIRAPRVQDDRILVPPDPARLGTRLEAFFKLAARQRLHAATERHARTLGRTYRRITLRDTRSRWGSCTQDGSLMYSWRLVMAPESVLDYVAAHEVAHLAEMNHSPAFWAVVARLRPDFAADRSWLRRHGGALHAIRFRD
ncbi:MAG: M48 family metallopeptidase [Rhodobacteraceae bacterium]|nr:M48 family metallopeptidase [Paracoccaceae bacterium]